MKTSPVIALGLVTLFGVLTSVAIEANRPKLFSPPSAVPSVPVPASSIEKASIRLAMGPKLPTSDAGRSEFQKHIDDAAEHSGKSSDRSLGPFRQMEEYNKALDDVNKATESKDKKDTATPLSLPPAAVQPPQPPPQRQPAVTHTEATGHSEGHAASGGGGGNGHGGEHGSHMGEGMHSVH